ncbi:MAG TPA: hypothetical protein DDW76_17695 [Cyanobacteria bacterium UBA11369]|nr:hypothetical protein [Cyanobacteria bacterium UBA11371]HBE35170.1 hypothetical protein [Cyanobacteria bacterium UBA11368]HBE50578.1 hypothetical protein [Cyanobacteria bacterium UBA11369]
MFTQVWSKLLVSAASTALMTLAIGTAAANAITFTFEGTRIRGSYKIDDAVYNSWLSQVSKPQPIFPEYSDLERFYLEDAVTDFKLFLDGVEIDYGSNFGSNIEGISYKDSFDSENNLYSWHMGFDTYGRMGPNLFLNVAKEGGNGADCLTPGKVCSGEVGVQYPFFSVGSQYFKENMTHYVSTGLSQNDPWRANQRNGNQSIFENVQSDLWFDAAADGYEFEASGDSLFTEILSLPGGVDANNLLTVTVGDRTLGQFRAGDKIDFVSLVGSGVSKFKVSGISAQNGKAAPMKLGFNQETASFKMTSLSGVGTNPPNNNPKSVPEPTSVIAFLLVGGALVVKRQISAKSA